jgi:hypothetical protein
LSSQVQKLRGHALKPQSDRVRAKFCLNRPPGHEVKQAEKPTAEDKIASKYLKKCTTFPKIEQSSPNMLLFNASIPFSSDAHSSRRI